MLSFLCFFSRPILGFQTKLTYGMICYTLTFSDQYLNVEFQTKLTYGMICYVLGLDNNYYEQLFQTKLTYGMICYN